MWRVFRAFAKWSFLISASAAGSLTFGAEPLQRFDGCTFIETDWADGDSFLVEMLNGERHVLRLYFVDCIETGISTTSDKRRLREQSRYFGLEDYKLTHGFGLKATAFTRSALKKPFTVHTAFASARGRSGKPRFYAFITTGDGDDLGELLVSNGLARAYGLGREAPDGTRRDDYDEFLSDIELAAAIRKKGAWSKSDPEAIVVMRKQERDELRGLEALEDLIDPPSPGPPTEPVDLNTASLEELISTGLRESLADAAIQMRPFQKVEDLEKVKGIGPKTMERVSPFLKVVPDSSDVRAE